MDYELTPIEACDVPDISRNGKYETVLREFVSSGAPAAKIWVANVAAITLVSSLKSTARRLKLPVEVMGRKDDVFLLRKDGA